MDRRRQIIFIGLFLASLAGVPLIQAGLDVASGDAPQVLDLVCAWPSAGHFRRFDQELLQNSWFEQNARKPFQLARYLLLRDPGAKAVAGDAPWLFFRPGLRWLIEPSAILRSEVPEADRDPVAAIADLRDQLARRGIRLLVVPTPGKASIVPQHLARAVKAGPDLWAHSLAFRAALQARGVEVAWVHDDLYRAGKRGPEALYLATDTHFTCSGAQVVADAVAARVRAMGGLGPEDRTVFGVRPVSVQRRGDLPRMTEIPWADRLFEPERQRCNQVFARRTGKPFAPEDDAQVLVLGDSFSRIYQTDEPGSAGLLAHLAGALGMPVAAIVNDGGASSLVRKQLARRPELLDGKRLVIYQFAERDIRFGLEGWPRVDLPEAG